MRRGTGIIAIIAVGVVLFIGYVVLMAAGNAATRKTEHIRVIDKARECDGGRDGGCYYVIYSDRDPYFNRDNIAAGKSNSGSLQARIIVGRCYAIETVGVRLAIPGERQFRNILTATEEPCPAG